MSPYLYFIGHSTTFFDLGGQTFLTDPLLRPQLGLLRRKKPLPPLPDFEENPPCVLLSHGHGDHLHVPSLRDLGKDLTIFAPEEVAAWLRKKNFLYAEAVSPGDSISWNGCQIEVVPADHPEDGNLLIRQRRPIGGAVGYVVSRENRSVYFAGDTDLFPEMSDMPSPDLALLPISGWGNSLGPGHLDPQRAAEAVERINPEHVVPIHWGSLSPLGMPRSWAVDRWADHEFFQALYRRGLDEKLQLLAPGEFLFLDQPEDKS